MKREFVVVEDEDEYGEIILSLAAMEVRRRRLQHEGARARSAAKPPSASAAAAHALQPQPLATAPSKAWARLCVPAAQRTVCARRPRLLRAFRRCRRRTPLLPPRQAQTFWQRIRQMQEEDVPVMVTVVAANRGGLMVQYAHLEGFIPISQLGQVRGPGGGAWGGGGRWRAAADAASIWKSKRWAAFCKLHPGSCSAAAGVAAAAGSRSAAAAAAAPPPPPPPPPAPPRPPPPSAQLLTGATERQQAMDSGQLGRAAPPDAAPPTQALTPTPPHPTCIPQNINAENMETYVGYDIPAKFLDVDEESERLVFSHRRASSSADMQGYKVGARCLSGGGRRHGGGSRAWHGMAWHGMAWHGIARPRGRARGGSEGWFAPGLRPPRLASLPRAPSPPPARVLPPSHRHNSRTSRTSTPPPPRAPGRRRRGRRGAERAPLRRLCRHRRRDRPAAHQPDHARAADDGRPGAGRGRQAQGHDPEPGHRPRPRHAVHQEAGGEPRRHAARPPEGARPRAARRCRNAARRQRRAGISSHAPSGRCRPPPARVLLPPTASLPSPPPPPAPPQVFENADRMAEMFKARVAAADSAVLGSFDGDGGANYPLDSSYPPPAGGLGGAPMAGQEQAATFDA
jgi:hypothetical protein